MLIYYLKLSDSILPVKACFLSSRVYRAPESSVHRAEYAMLSMYRSQYGYFPINLRLYAASNVDSAGCPNCSKWSLFHSSAENIVVDFCVLVFNGFHKESYVFFYELGG